MTRHSRQSVWRALTVATTGGLLFFLPVSVGADFKDPTAAPPVNNLIEPINVGSSPQYRVAALRIGSIVQTGIGADALQVQVPGSRSNALIRDNFTAASITSPASAFLVNSSNEHIVRIGDSNAVAAILQVGLLGAPGLNYTIGAESTLVAGNAIYLEKLLGTDAPAIVASAPSSTAVVGQNTQAAAGSPANAGVVGTNLFSGRGVEGSVTSATATSGVVGIASTSATDIGVRGYTNGSNGYGVTAEGAAVGLQAAATTSTASIIASLYGASPPNAGQRYGLFVETPTVDAYSPTQTRDRYAAYLAGPLRATGEVSAKSLHVDATAASLVPQTLRTKRLEATTGSTPHGLAFDGTYVWVANEAEGGGTPSVAKVRASDGFVAGTYTGIAGLENPHAVLFDGTAVWVGDSNATVNANLFKLNPADGSLLASCTIGAITGGTSLRDLATDGTWIWATNPTTLIKVDPSCSQVTTYTFATDIRGLSYDGTYFWMADRGNDWVIRFLPSIGAVNSFSVVPSGGSSGYRPNSVTFDGTYVWVGDEGNGTTVTSRLSKLDQNGLLIKEYTPAELRGVDRLFFDGVHLWSLGAATDPNQSAFANGRLLQFSVIDGRLLSQADLAVHSGATFDGTNLWASQSGTGKILKIGTAGGFDQGDPGTALALQTASPGTAQLGNFNVGTAGQTFSIGVNLQLGGNLVVNGNVTTADAALAVPSTGTGVRTECATNGHFITQLATNAAGQVTSIVCSSL